MRWLPVTLALLVALGARPAFADSRPSPTLGAVVGLAATPHLWIADEQGILHWGGDTRALLQHVVRWNDRTDLTAQQLAESQRGDPWLTAGLLKMGDPIYLVKWETDQSLPKLLHIQCIADVELFGINARNYGNFILEQAEWERRYGLSVSGLPKEELPSSCSAPSPAPGGSGSVSSATGGGSGSAGGGVGGVGGTAGSGSPVANTGGGGMAVAPESSSSPTSGTTSGTAPEDQQQPTGWSPGNGTDAAGNRYMLVAFRDTGTGLASVTITCTRNARVDVPSFVPGTTETVNLRVTQVSSASTAVAVFEVSDQRGNRGQLSATILHSGTQTGSSGC